jgi:hypothetical protein
MSHRAKDLLFFYSKTDELKLVFDYIYQCLLSEKDQTNLFYRAVSDAGLEGKIINSLIALPAGEPGDPIGKDLAARYNEQPAQFRTLWLSGFYLFAMWRLTQSIYRFDETLYNTLLDTVLEGEIPPDLLSKLPQGIVYIETPGLMAPIGNPDYQMKRVYGFWASYQTSQDMKVLQLAFDSENLYETHYPYSFSVVLSDGKIQDAFKATAERVKQIHPDTYRDPTQEPNHLYERMTEVYLKCLNLLFYLCADPELTVKHKVVPIPQMPQPKKVKGGLRFFPAQNETVYCVGERLGIALKDAFRHDEALNDADGNNVRPHIRRAHWHHFRIGAMKTSEGQHIPAQFRNLKLEWLAPITVNLKKQTSTPLQSTANSLPENDPYSQKLELPCGLVFPPAGILPPFEGLQIARNGDKLQLRMLYLIEFLRQACAEYEDVKQILDDHTLAMQVLLQWYHGWNLQTGYVNPIMEKVIQEIREHNMIFVVEGVDTIQ